MNIQIQKKNQSEIEPSNSQSDKNIAAESDSQSQSVDDYQVIIKSETETVSVSEPLPIDDIKSRWTSFLEFLLKEHPNLGSFLSLAYIGNVTSDAIELKFSGDYRFQHMEVSKKQNHIEIARLLQEFCGKSLDLQITLDANAPRVEDTNYIKQIADIPSTIDDQIEKEPIIKTILDIFDGEILN